MRDGSWMPGLRLPLAAVVAGVVLAGAVTAGSAWARPACTFAVFQCGASTGPDGEPVINFKDIKTLRSEGRSDAWIRKRCRAQDLTPDGCDWSRGASSGGWSGGGSGSGAGGGQTTVLVDSAPSLPAAGPRDARGRLGPTPAPAERAALSDDGPYAADLAAAAARYKLPVHLLRAVMTVESGGNPQAVSHKGALGLMQLIPATARAMGVDDPHDPAQSIAGGARFLRVLANRFDGDLVKVLSAYHAGSTRVLGRDATPFAATDDYVRKVLRLYYQLRDAAARRGTTDR